MSANWFLKTRSELLDAILAPPKSTEEAQGGGSKPPRAPSSRQRVWFAVGVFVLALGLYAARTLGARSEVEVTVHPVSRGRIRERVPAVSLGRVSARRELALRAEFPGRVQRIEHRTGERVTAGEELLQLSAQELSDSVVRAEKALATARAQAAEAATRAELAVRRGRRAATLLASGSIPPAEGEAARLESRLAQQTALTALARVGEATAARDAARTALSNSVVRAPWDGIVLELHVEEGAAVTGGSMLLTLADDSALHVAASIDEADLGRVSVGMPVELAFEATGESPQQRRVSSIDPSVIRGERGARVVALRVDLDVGTHLPVGSGVQVEVISKENASALLVPVNAVTGTGSLRDVYVAVDGVARRRVVEVGIASWDSLEVKRGLSLGELTILNPGQAKLEDGGRVAPRLDDAASGGRR